MCYGMCDVVNFVWKLVVVVCGEVGQVLFDSYQFECDLYVCVVILVVVEVGCYICEFDFECVWECDCVFCECVWGVVIGIVVDFIFVICIGIVVMGMYVVGECFIQFCFGEGE